MGGIPTLRAKRSANTARDMPPARASWSTVQRRATSTWISPKCAGQPGIRETREQPLRLSGRGRRAKAEGLDEQHLDEALENRGRGDVPSEA